jgi:hypothetical protein
MLSLAGDSIIMTPLAYLTAVDTSVTHPLNPKDTKNNPVSVELEQVKRSLAALTSDSGNSSDKTDAYKTLFTYIHPVAFGSMERMSSLSERLCRDILGLRNSQGDQEGLDSLIHKLNSEYPSHGYPITRKVARGLGLPVVDSDGDLNRLLWKFININRYVTEPVRTDVSEVFIHTEKYVNIIESIGRRYSVRNYYDRRLDAMIKNWTTTRDEYKWEAASEAVNDKGEKTLRITTLDF